MLIGAESENSEVFDYAMFVSPQDAWACARLGGE